MTEEIDKEENKLDEGVRKLSGIVERFTSMDLKTVQGYLYLFIFLLILDMFGIIWLLNLKKIGIILFIVCLLFIGFFTILQKKIYNDMPDKMYRELQKKESKVRNNKERYDPVDLGLDKIGNMTKDLNKDIRKGLGF